MELQTDIFTRTRMLIGNGADKLASAAVLVCGLGGVGGYVVEGLVRGGIGRIGVLDNDSFGESNLNRQILATTDTVGRLKTDVAIERILSINPNCKTSKYDLFYMPDTADRVELSEYDYIVDAMDTVTAKLTLIERAVRMNVPIISCMGTGNKLGTNFEVTDIYRTSVCPLAKVMRKELKARGIRKLKVIYSKEAPVKPQNALYESGRHVPGSISYAPAIAGMTAAGEVINDLLSMHI